MSSSHNHPTGSQQITDQDLEQTIENLDGKDWQDRKNAAEQLRKWSEGKQLGTDKDYALRALQTRAEKESDYEVAFKIMEAISAVEMPIPELVIELRKNLTANHGTEIRRAAANSLKAIGREAHEAFPDLKKCVTDSSSGAEYQMRVDAFCAIKVIGEKEEVNAFVELLPEREYGTFLVENGQDVLDNIWETRTRPRALQFVLAADPGSVTAAWLRKRAPYIPADKSIPEAIKNQLIATLRTWKLNASKGRVYKLLDETLAILEGQTAIQQWVDSIAIDDINLLVQVEITAEEMRSDPNVIHYLVSQFEDRKWESTRLGEILVNSPIEMEQVENLRRKISSFHIKSEEDRLDHWFSYLASQSNEFAEVKSSNNFMRSAEFLEIEREEEKKKLRVRRRIVKQLAEMSDYVRFFEGKLYINSSYIEEDSSSQSKDVKWNLSLYNETIREQLNRHVVVVFGRRLSKESDENIRANMARTLANIGGRESVETLVQAVIGEEGKQVRRQRTLDDYYLRPSRDRGEEAARMLRDAINQATHTMWILQGLNVALFLVGLGMIIYSYLLLNNANIDNKQHILAAISAFGGFAAMITSFIKNPLDRIQNAMSKLVQLESTFSGFVWAINLNSTYIQSQYVAKGILSDDDIALTVSRIEEAMSLTLRMIQTYTVQQEQRIERLIYSLSSEQMQGKTIITVYGQSLRGDSSKILVNHRPLEVQADLWTDTKVQFTLPAQEGDESADIWVSLSIDGMETNPLSCRG